MGSNSIRSVLTKDTQISTIKLLLSADIHHEKQIIVVEGPDDILFCDVVLEWKDIQESFSGKHGVYEIVDYFHDDRVIGICDLDYETNPSIEGIFYYDHSCLEMMMVSSDSTFTSVYTSNCKGWKKPLEARHFILSELQLLSRFRQKNYLSKLEINFNGISVSKACNKKTGTLDNESIAMQLLDCNLKNAKINDLLIINEDENKISEGNDYYDITQGHDFLGYLQSICSYFPRYRKDIPNTTALLKSFVSTYKKEFQRSKLFLDLRNRHII